MPAAITFAPFRSSLETSVDLAERGADQGLSPESDLFLAMQRAARELGQFGDRIEGGIRRAGEDYRVGQADLARVRRVFNEGIEALGRYQHRRRGGAS